MQSKKMMLVSAIALALMGVGGVAMTSTEKEALTARAEAGEPAALLDAGKALLTGAGMPKDVDRGILFLERLTQIGGQHAAFAHTALAQHYEITANDSPQSKAAMVRHYRLAAGLGDTVAQVKVAKILLSTIAGSTDPSFTVQAQAQARSLLEHASRNRNVEAAWELGYALMYGRGLPQDTVASEEWLRHAADRNHVNAAYLLASMYIQNPGSESFKPISARRYFEIAASAGHAGSLIKLAEGFENGRYWPANIDEAVTWSRRARDAGAPRAGEIFERTLAIQTAERERKRQEEIARLAAEKARQEQKAAEAAALLASNTPPPGVSPTATPQPLPSSFQPVAVSTRSPDYALTPSTLPAPQVSTALTLETVSASAPASEQITQLRSQVGMLTSQNQAFRSQLMERDRMIAQLTTQRDTALQQVKAIQTRLDQLQTNGQTYFASNPAADQTQQRQARRNPAVLASSKNAEGMTFYKTGDFRRASRNWEQAANAGNLEAMNNLGMLHLQGKLGAADVTTAVNHFRAAADRGHATAANNLGYIYEHGIGVGRDLSRARVWYARAAELGLPAARQNLHNIGGNMVAGL